MSPALSLLILLGAEAVALKEKAVVSGRWVRIADLLDLDRTDPATRGRIADLYIGRSPEEGQTRTITADEIRRELDIKGIALDAAVWSGESVEVSRGISTDTESLRKSVAKALLRQSGAALVRIVRLEPETCAGDVVEVKPNGSAYIAVMSGGEKIDVVARILRLRDGVFAARDIAPGRRLERSDLETHRIEVADGDPVLEMDLVVGSVAAQRIRLASPITVADLRLKPAVRKGDLVRAVSSGYEVDARALEDGAAGQEIALEFASSKNRLRGRVVDASRVDVLESAR
ncbi:MAG TPA: flagellar basal body P-ring formation chaperone FlgA [Planctomycetota bacterium]|nr:flagellar basal body P-ring formation chaperone FlgA [Planctomycetota bacterium]